MIGGNRLWVTRKSHFLEEPGARVGRGLIMEVLEGEPDLMDAGGLEMECREAGQVIALTLGQVGRIARP